MSWKRPFRIRARSCADMLFTPEMSGLLDGDRARAIAHLTDEAHDSVLAAK